MTSTEFVELQRTIAQLRRQVEALSSRVGDSSATRRLISDVDRLEVATEGHAREPLPRVRPIAEVVQVPDTPYDRSLWHGADEEGIGGHYRCHP